MVDVHRLRIFVKIAELKSFTLAAKSCMLTQPTVSQHVAALEGFLGLKLFDRRGKDLYLTGAGEILYRHAKEITALFDVLFQSLELYKGKKIGRLRLGASTIPGEHILMELLGEFRDICPDLKISVRITDTEQVVKMLLDRSVDLAVVGAELKQRGLVFTPLMPDELVLIVPKGHRWWKASKIEMKDVIREPFVMRESGSGTRMELGRKLQSIGIDPVDLHVVAEVGTTTAVKEAVESGLGISFVSRLSIEKELKYKVFKHVPVRNFVCSRWIYLVRESGRTPSPVSSAFVKFLKVRSKM